MRTPEHRIPGGCDDCTAYQVLTETEPNLIVLEVRHDATCPTYRAIVNGRNSDA